MRGIARTTLTLLVVATVGLVLLPASASAATINVDSSTAATDELNSDGDCSLREAIQSANVDGMAQTEGSCETGSGLDTVQVPSGSFVLSIPAVADDITTGDLETTDPDGLQIVGAGRTTTRIDGGDQDRILEVLTGDVTVQAVSLQNGTAQAASPFGGGILASDAVTLVDARVGDNDAGVAGGGGGIQMTSAPGLLTLNNSTIELNDAPGAGGGINLSSGASVVANSGTTIRQNTAGADGGGINLGTGSGDITINAGAFVDNNDAVANGGGINHNSGDAGANVIIDGGTVAGNDVAPAIPSGLASGGGISYFNGSGGQLLLSNGASVSNNGATGAEATGGGINANVSGGSPSFSIANSAVSGNDVIVSADIAAGSLEGGGGITLTGTGSLNVTDSAISGNTVTVNDSDDTASGAGILGSPDSTSGAFTLNRVLVSGNQVLPGMAAATQGGGLAVYNPVVAPSGILNSTFSSNAGGATGGAILAPNTQALTIAHTTFALNTAVTAAAINFHSGGGPGYTIRGSIFDQPGMNPACVPNTLSGVNGYNVDAGTSCVGVADDTDLESTSAVLGALGTSSPALAETHALLAGSPAINLVPVAQCLDLSSAALAVDQRGLGRSEPAGGNCDAGSHEVQDTDNDGLLDTADSCPTQSAATANGCPAASTTPLGPTFDLPAAIKKCKKKFRKGTKARKKCIRKARARAKAA